MKVSYSGNDGVNIRDSRYINTSSNLHGALFPQETFLLEQIGDVVETGGRQWVQLEVKGWIPVKNHSQVFLSPIGNGKWKVNKTSDGFLSMRTGTSSKTPLVCKLKYATVITELNRDFTDSTYHYVFGTFRGWAVKRSSSQEYIRYIY